MVVRMEPVHTYESERHRMASDDPDCPGDVGVEVDCYVVSGNEANYIAACEEEWRSRRRMYAATDARRSAFSAMSVGEWDRACSVMDAMRGEP